MENIAGELPIIIYHPYSVMKSVVQYEYCNTKVLHQIINHTLPRPYCQQSHSVSSLNCSCYQLHVLIRILSSILQQIDVKSTIEIIKLIDITLKAICWTFQKYWNQCMLEFMSTCWLKVIAEEKLGSRIFHLAALPNWFLIWDPFPYLWHLSNVTQLDVVGWFMKVSVMLIPFQF